MKGLLLALWWKRRDTNSADHQGDDSLVSYRNAVLNRCAELADKFGCRPQPFWKPFSKTPPGGALAKREGSVAITNFSHLANNFPTITGGRTFSQPGGIALCTYIPSHIAPGCRRRRSSERALLSQRRKFSTVAIQSLLTWQFAVCLSPFGYGKSKSGLGFTCL